MHHVERNLALTRQYGMPPIDALGKALVENGRVHETVRYDLENGGGELNGAGLDEHLRYLHTIEARYRSDWLVKDNPSKDAQKARAALESVAHTEYIEDEKRALDTLADALRRLDADVHTQTRNSNGVLDDLMSVQISLRHLINLSTTYVIYWQTSLEREAAMVRTMVAFVTASGIALATYATFRVRRTIAPRIRQLVDKVRKFREIGVHERVFDSGGDEISVLANAIDAGFGAIVERDKERERFLAIVAHELKTPVSSILGFARAAKLHSDDAEVGRKALEVVERHGARLERLLEDVLLAARARVGDLPVHRGTTDLAKDVRRVVEEVEASGQLHRFSIETPTSAPVLADEGLLMHALWTLLTYAVAISPPCEPVRIRVMSEPPQSTIEVNLRGRDLAQEEFERALAPFGTLVYEGSGARTGVGLFLCREIARLHGGALRMDGTSTGIRVTMELPS